MKKALGLAVLMLFAVSTTAFGQADMAGDSHDFSSTGPAVNPNLTETNYDDQICVVCHAPHLDESDAVIVAYEATYLWNRSGSDATTYSMYDSNTIDGAQDAVPATESKMCLSCHDGSVGLEDFDGNEGGTTIVQDSAKAGTLSGTNLDMSREHPISLEYDVSDDGLIAVATAETDGVNLYSQGGGTPRVECGSCHDPHLQNIDVAAEDNLLRLENTQSALCTACHDK
jgi:predicted CXXCH cytochrome family protein